MGQSKEAARRIMIVDDNRMAADSLADLLRDRGQVVEVTYTGRDAINIAARIHPDVALLDLGMPDMDGFATCGTLRDSAEGEKMVIIAVSGWGDAGTRKRSAEAGFDRHVPKPAHPDELLTLIEQCGRERRPLV